MGVLGAIGNQIKAYNPLANAAYALTGGQVGVDATPNYSATNVVRTQLGSSPAPVATPQPNNRAPAPGPTPAPAPAPSGQYGGDATSAADAADKAASLFQIDSGIQAGNSALGRLDNQLNTGVGNIDRDFNSAWQELIGKRAQAEADTTQDRNTQLNEYESARNRAGQTARSYVDNASRTLGANGAGGGSTARFVVPGEGQRIAAEGNGAAQATNNKNIIAIDQAWNRNKDEFDNSQNDLIRQKVQGTNDLRSRVEQQRADLLTNVATLLGQKTIANGGSYQQASAAAAPMTSRISSILDTIDSLAQTPQIATRSVTVDRPDLSGYNYAQPAAPVAAAQDPTLSNPLLAALFAPQQDDQRLQFA